MWGLLLGVVGALDLLAALAVLVAFTRTDLVVAVLGWGLDPAGWPDGEELEPEHLAVLRAMARRLRWVLLGGLAATSFTAGALLAWIRLQG